MVFFDIFLAARSSRADDMRPMFEGETGLRALSAEDSDLPRFQKLKTSLCWFMSSMQDKARIGKLIKAPIVFLRPSIRGSSSCAVCLGGREVLAKERRDKEELREQLGHQTCRVQAKLRPLLLVIGPVGVLEKLMRGPREGEGNEPKERSWACSPCPAQIGFLSEGKLSRKSLHFPQV